MKKPSSARPGRPKSAEKRAIILEAAGNLFLNQGLQNTSMDAVAENAGVSKQTVYSHFESKEALYQAVIVNKVASYGFAEAAVLPEDNDLEDALLTMGLRFMNLLFDAQVVAMHRVVIGESVTYPRIAELFYETGPGTTRRTIGAFLRRQLERGRLVIDDLDYAASQFLNMVCGPYQMLLLMNMKPELSDELVRSHLRKVVQQFLRLYSKQQASHIPRTRPNRSH